MFVSGTENDDNLTGTIDADLIFGYGGNDNIYGDAGDDYINAGDGNDTVKGKAGNDYILGLAGDDRIYGEAGDDRLFGMEGNDYIDGGSGNDLMDGGLGDDYYYVQDVGDIVIEKPSGGRDTIYSTVNYDLSGTEVESLILSRDVYGENALKATGNGLDNYISGNEFNNIISALGGNDIIYAWEGNDKVNGGSGNDRIYGGQGNDTLFGDQGNDTLFGDQGNDYLVGGEGNDYINGYGSIVTNDSQFDRLTGGLGSDTFVLGESGKVFYNETGDGYAVIQDWNPIMPNSNSISMEFDRIQLAGNASQYQLKFKSVSGIGNSAKDTEILFNSNNSWERIGIVQDSINVALDRDFTFV